MKAETTHLVGTGMFIAIIQGLILGGGGGHVRKTRYILVTGTKYLFVLHSKK